MKTKSLSASLDELTTKRILKALITSSLFDSSDLIDNVDKIHAGPDDTSIEGGYVCLYGNAVRVSIDALLKTSKRKGQHLIYRFHVAKDENNVVDWTRTKGELTEDPCPIYIGQTKQGFQKRFSQHIQAAANGSHCLSHRYLAKYFLKHQRVTIDILDYGLTQDEADDLEEKLVGEQSLYPYGLNMIPGGKAGLAYLGKHGVKVSRRGYEKPWNAINKLMAREGNPLLSFRYMNDDELISRIICNNPNNFSVEEVRKIRALSGIGWPVEDIGKHLGLSEEKYYRVEHLLEGKRYARVK